MQLSRFKWNHWLALSVALPALAFCLSVPALLWLSGQEHTHFLNQGILYAAAGVLTMAGIQSLRDLYDWKALDKSINTLAFGLFCALFVAGFALLKLNHQWGYAALCREAVEVAKESQAPVSAYCAYEIHRAENMDVFLQKDVCIVTKENLVSGTLRGVVLMFPMRELDFIRTVVPESGIHVVGYYGFVCI